MLGTLTVASGDVIEWFESNKNCHRNSITGYRPTGLLIVGEWNAKKQPGWASNDVSGIVINARTKEEKNFYKWM